MVQAIPQVTRTLTQRAENSVQLVPIWVEGSLEGHRCSLKPETEKTYPPEFSNLDPCSLKD